MLFDFAVSPITGHLNGPTGDYYPCSPFHDGSVYVDKSESHERRTLCRDVPAETGLRVFLLRTVPSLSLIREKPQSTTSLRLPRRSTSRPSGGRGLHLQINRGETAENEEEFSDTEDDGTECVDDDTCGVHTGCTKLRNKLPLDKATQDNFHEHVASTFDVKMLFLEKDDG